MIKYFAASSLLMVLAQTAQAEPVASHIIEHDGGSVILHVMAGPDAEGMLRGAIEFDNNEGWKTYWRDPGSSGIPPGLEVSWGEQALGSDIRFPVPTWIDDGYGAYAGYYGDITLPVEIDLSSATAMNDTPLTAWFFAGVCREVCIPVMGSFEIEASAAGFESSMKSVTTINTAFSNLPELVERDTLVNTIETAEDGGWLLTLDLPEGTSADDADVFVSAEHEGKIVASLAPPRLMDQATWHVYAPKGLPDVAVDLYITVATSDGQSRKTYIMAENVPQN